MLEHTPNSIQCPFRYIRPCGGIANTTAGHPFGIQYSVECKSNKSIKWYSSLQSQLRLTYNYWRKGGYSIGSEDYRWAVLREKINPPLFFVFNVVFISLAQSVSAALPTTNPRITNNSPSSFSSRSPLQPTSSS